MPTELPPGYKPQPANDPGNPADPKVPGSSPAYPPEQGADAVDDPTGGRARPGADVVDPGPGWTVPSPVPGPAGDGDPAPAGVPAI